MSTSSDNSRSSSSDEDGNPVVKISRRRLSELMFVGAGAFGAVFKGMS
jgi:hypothetical protein